MTLSREIRKPTKRLMPKKYLKSKLTTDKAVSIINNMKEESDGKAILAKKTKNIIEYSDEENSRLEDKIENLNDSANADIDETSDDEDTDETTEDEVTDDCSDEDIDDCSDEDEENMGEVIDFSAGATDDEDETTDDGEPTHPLILDEAEEMDDEHLSDISGDSDTDNLAFQTGSRISKAKLHQEDVNTAKESLIESDEEGSSLDGFIVSDSSDEDGNKYESNHFKGISDSDEELKNFPESEHDYITEDVSLVEKRVPVPPELVIACSKLSFDVVKMSESRILESYGEPLHVYQSVNPLLLEKCNDHANQEEGSTINGIIYSPVAGSDSQALNAEEVITIAKKVTSSCGNDNLSGSKKRKLWEFNSEGPTKKKKIV